ncbi:hypothetical protein Anas_04201 [Armadillidium nasatum]|uniref:Uncharacterized protein n=1 Tax=Armadillidium nasatum TaxID=96803 RepID=A0A5N5SJ69_9CRUS|nr:hypothetical protein Anas_04201 [Armadillidium nasatum]
MTRTIFTTRQALKSCYHILNLLLFFTSENPTQILVAKRKIKISFHRVTLGNQLEGVNLLEEDLVKGFREHYPDGY